MAYSRDTAGGAGPRVGAGASLIDRDSHFDGVFRTSGDLLIEGEYEGEIHCDGTVTIADSARVSGTVQAGMVSVAGALLGEVDCAGRFEILASGQVSASVISGAIIVREGAFYEGEMRMRDAPPGLAALETGSWRGAGMATLQSDAVEPEHVAEAAPPAARRSRNGHDAAPEPIVSEG